jgi:hypothetical protein
MHRKLYSVLLVSLFAAGCGKPDASDMEMPKKPPRAPEMEALAPLVGTWSGTAEMVKPSAEDMKKSMPEGAPAPQTTFAGGTTYKWDIGGLFLHAEGWFEMGEGQKCNNHELIGWDPVKKMYHGWYVSDYGERGDNWMKANSDGKSFTMKMSGIGMNSKAMKGSGSMTFVDANTIEWTWVEKNALGGTKMEMKGTMKKQG